MIKGKLYTTHATQVADANALFGKCDEGKENTELIKNLFDTAQYIKIPDNFLFLRRNSANTKTWARLFKFFVNYL